MSWKVTKTVEEIEKISTEETEEAMEMVHTVYVEVVFCNKVLPNEGTRRIYRAIEEVVADQDGKKTLQSAEDFLNERRSQNH